MTTFKGLVYVKHGAVGTKMEGPVYYLQMKTGEVILHYNTRQLWEPDYYLEFFSRRMVQIEGELTDERNVKVKRIDAICDPLIS